VGNPDDPVDKKLLANASPLFAADRITIPMLIAQGANDPRVIQSESDQIVGRSKRTAGARPMFSIQTKVTDWSGRQTTWTL
jgi:dipeptidyl aminopeptidase/acylaminoacyl peptidase